MKTRTSEEVKIESIEMVENWLNANTNYEVIDDYEISVKNDYLLLVIYAPNRKEIECIGEKINELLHDENLMGQYDYFELASCNRANSNKKLVFKLNIVHIINRDDFKATFKRIKRF